MLKEFESVEVSIPMTQPIADSPRLSNLSSKDAARTAFVLLLLVVIFRSCVLWLSNDRMNPDKIVQISVARSMVDGHGLTVRELVRNENLEIKLSERPMIGWAPGYALLQAAGILVLDDVVRFNVLLDLTAICALLGAWFSLMWQCFSNQDKVIPLVCAAMWILLPNPLDRITSNCLVSSAFFFGGLAFIPHWVVFPRRFRLGLWSGILCGLATWIQFRFLPLNTVLMAAAAWNAWQNRGMGWNALRVPIGVATGIASTIVPLVALQYLRLGSLTGGTLSSPGGFYWHHLLAYYPFPLEALGFEEAYQYAVYKYPVMGTLASVPTLYAVVSLVIVAMAVRAIVQSLRSSGTISNGTLTCTTVAGSCTAALIILMTTWFSLRHPVQHLGNGDWTPVQEDRYFFQIQPFLWMALAAALTSLLRTQRLGCRIGAGALIALMLIASASAQRVWISYTLDHQGMRAHMNKAREQTQSLAMFYTMEGLAKRGRTVVMLGDERSLRAVTCPAMISGGFLLEDKGDEPELQSRLIHLLGDAVLLLRVKASPDSDRFTFKVFANQLRSPELDAGWICEELGAK